MCLTLTNSISAHGMLHSFVGHKGDAGHPSSPGLSHPHVHISSYREFGSPRSQPSPAASEVTDPWQ